MKAVLNIVSILLVVVGIVWFFQGIGVIRGSFMTDDLTWSIIGIACIVVAGAIYYFNRLKSTAS
ncbi:MAG: hypothetical protein LCI00_27620 [Chloroflexi bacterium]|nr:hypothetical protein [Chloroflexota bacterium]MCC6897260.1 hypothetical protein [Anaerolineae bacterium]